MRSPVHSTGKGTRITKQGRKKKPKCSSSLMALSTEPRP